MHCNWMAQAGWMDVVGGQDCDGWGDGCWMDGDAGWTDGWTDGTHNKIKNTSKPTTTSTWNPNNSKQRDQHSQNNVKMHQQHAMYDNTKHSKKRTIHATGKEAQNPQNHNQPSQTNKMNKLKKQTSTAIAFHGRVCANNHQAIDNTTTSKITKNNPAPRNNKPLNCKHQHTVSASRTQKPRPIP